MRGETKEFLRYLLGVVGILSLLATVYLQQHPLKQQKCYVIENSVSLK